MDSQCHLLMYVFIYLFSTIGTRKVECRGVSVTVVSPGYVNTALSVNALSPDGSKYGVVDATTASGASPHKVWQ